MLRGFVAHLDEVIDSEVGKRVGVLCNAGLEL
jgi:hypothetical protein